MKPETAYQGLTSKVGFWAAITATIMVVGSTLAMIATLGSGAPDYSTIPLVMYTLWFAIAPTLVVLMICINDSTPSLKKVLSSIGLAFILVYTVTASLDYFTQMTVMRFALTYGPIQGLALFNNTNQHSMVYELEAINYGFQGLAFLFIAPLFRGTRLRNAIGVTLYINAVNGLLSMVGFALDLNWTILIGTFIVWIIFLPTTTALMAVNFGRDEYLRTDIKQSRPLG